MTKSNKLLERILSGTTDANIDFSDMRTLLSNLGFNERIKGSHHIFYKDGIEEILNLQPKEAKVKPYQVKQVRNVILKYKLRSENVE
jgi:predicted RNA binding protein YcfA (HicA-like mRNA interferase family)